MSTEIKNAFIFTRKKRQNRQKKNVEKKYGKHKIIPKHVEKTAKCPLWDYKHRILKFCVLWTFDEKTEEKEQQWAIGPVGGTCSIIIINKCIWIYLCNINIKFISHPILIEHGCIEKRNGLCPLLDIGHIQQDHWISSSRTWMPVARSLALVHVRQCCINNNNCFKASEKEISGGPRRCILS